MSWNPCIICGEKFYAAPCHLKKGRAKACSNKCRGISKRKQPGEHLIVDNCKPDADTGCWTWQKAKTGSGYGMLRVSLEDGDWLAHRYSYSIFKRPLRKGDGVVIRHSCDNPACVNPDHLDEGTHGDNARDRVERGRGLTGSKLANAKLTESDIPIIRGLLARQLSLADIARKYKVNERAISLIRDGQTWRHA